MAVSALPARHEDRLHRRVFDFNDQRRGAGIRSTRSTPTDVDDGPGSAWRIDPRRRRKLIASKWAADAAGIGRRSRYNAGLDTPCQGPCSTVATPDPRCPADRVIIFPGTGVGRTMVRRQGVPTARNRWACALSDLQDACMDLKRKIEEEASNRQHEMSRTGVGIQCIKPAFGVYRRARIHI